MRRSLVTLLAAITFSSGAALAEDDPKILLEKMNQALERTNYEGVFIHTHLGESETLKVIHRVDEQGEVAERLVSLDGSGREIIRDEDQVRCILPDRRTVYVERRNKHGRFFASFPRYTEDIDSFYDFVVYPSEKLLHLDTVVLGVSPRDSFRYGYKLWLERSTLLPLKTQLLGEDGAVIEQILFHSITLAAEISSEAVEAGVDAGEFAWYYDDSEGAGQDGPAGDRTWEARELPPGFALRVSDVTYLPESRAPTEHMVYSDGLATVSVFIESDEEKDEGLSLGTSQMGAAHAFTKKDGAHFVTAVGEVPEDTVRMIAISMQRLSGEAEP